jgi:pSer/pThr/pTyr-binding forkhead associated (FHA) protein
MPATWKLIIEDDAGKQIVVPFTRDVITIGRKEGNTIRLTERNVSRNHARLAKENGHVVLEDLKSFNGIKLNGDRIEGRVLVHEGDTIQIGDYHLALHAQDGAGLNAPTQQMVSPNGTRAPPLKSAAMGTQPTHQDDDEFAGDTQRWEPSPGMPGVSVQSLPTQEDRPPITDEHTERAVAVTAKTVEQPHNSFGADNGDTERVTMKAGAPSGVPRRQEVDEPTVRQVASPPPITLPPSVPMNGGLSNGGPMSLGPMNGGPSPLSATTPIAPAPSAGGNAALHAQTIPSAPAPMPEPRPPSLPSQPPPAARPSASAEARRALDEQTEQHRPAPAVADDVALPRLVVLNTIFAGSTFTLRSAEAVIGRTEGNDITIEHKSVSRNHAKVVREGDRVRILDLKSANGVLVNNEEVEAAVLRSGDVVELGRVKLRFVPVGERFAVPPDEIERARIADAAGDDFDGDTGTGVTNPVRQKQKSSPPSAQALPTTGDYPPIKQGPSTGMIVVGAAVILVVVILAGILLTRGKKDDETPAPSPPVKVDATPPPADPTPVDVKPAEAKPDEAKPAEAKPAEAKPDDVKPVNAADTPPAEVAVNDDDGAPDPAPSGGERKPREPKRPSDAKLESFKIAGTAAYIKKDWKTAVDEYRKYVRWVKDDKVVNRNYGIAQDELDKAK